MTPEIQPAGASSHHWIRQEANCNEIKYLNGFMDKEGKWVEGHLEVIRSYGGKIQSIIIKSEGLDANIIEKSITGQTSAREALAEVDSLLKHEETVNGDPFKEFGSKVRAGEATPLSVVIH